MYVGFGTLEQLVDDLQQDSVQQVRVDHFCIPEAVDEYAGRLDHFGVMISTQVETTGGQVRYAWVIVGSRQQLYDGMIVSGEDVPAQTEVAYDRIVAWLQEQGFETRHGSYSFPADLRLRSTVAVPVMVAAVECIERAG